MEEEDEAGEPPRTQTRHIKKRALRNKALSISFDEKDLKDFVTGFHKRKKKRRKEAERQLQEVQRRKRIELRKKRKMEREFVQYGGAPAETSAGPDERGDNSEQDEEIEPVPSVSVQWKLGYQVEDMHSRLRVATWLQIMPVQLVQIIPKFKFITSPVHPLRHSWLGKSISKISLGYAWIMDLERERKRVWIHGMLNPSFACCFSALLKARTTMYDNGDVKVIVMTSEISREEESPSERPQQATLGSIEGDVKKRHNVPVNKKKPLKRVVKNRSRKKAQNKRDKHKGKEKIKKR
ncbi:hypothetical protein TEA_022496 [Camellia sinensis var. sinensis]|uniref:Ribosomal RNA-processing protein 17 n=1 Tax=Camellia sinensis var. sinensis TaxID=542762 RepID=A0A4V3WQ29_CAMSN|nr:hypothetical protein TEA_022496 [Camellia sinensis var. sinensis]